jgi:hypothetical protein
MKVYRDDQYYYIEPPSPEVVYLPYYDPNVAYGRWWWPSYQPIWWRPWPGYHWLAGYNGFAWGFGYTVGSGFFYSGWNWPARHIYFNDKWPRYHRGWDQRHGYRWWHDGPPRGPPARLGTDAAAMASATRTRTAAAARATATRTRTAAAVMARLMGAGMAAAVRAKATDAIATVAAPIAAMPQPRRWRSAPGRVTTPGENPVARVVGGAAAFTRRA